MTAPKKFRRRTPDQIAADRHQERHLRIPAEIEDDARKIVSHLTQILGIIGTPRNPEYQAILATLATIETRKGYRTTSTLCEWPNGERLTSGGTWSTALAILRKNALADWLPSTSLHAIADRLGLSVSQVSELISSGKAKKQAAEKQAELDTIVYTP